MIIKELIKKIDNDDCLLETLIKNNDMQYLVEQETSANILLTLYKAAINNSQFDIAYKILYYSLDNFRYINELSLKEASAILAKLMNVKYLNHIKIFLDAYDNNYFLFKTCLNESADIINCLLQMEVNNKIDKSTFKDTNLPIAYIFYTAMPGGFGDLRHFIDFLSFAKLDDFQNAFFVIETLRNSTSFNPIQEEINFLPDNHPLKIRKDNIVIIFNDTVMKDAIALSTKLYKYLNISTYCISSGIGILEKLFVNKNIIVSAELLEHQSNYKYSVEGRGNLLTFRNCLSIGGNSPGIFIRKSNKETKIHDVSEQESLIVFYAHENFAANIKQICLLNKCIKNNNWLTIFFAIKEEFKLSEEIESLLNECNCKIIIKNTWISADVYEKLLAQQAATSHFGLAAGDKTTERCIADGLFPIIEFTHDFKYKFWLQLIITIEAILFKKQNEKIMQKKIIEYLYASIKFVQDNQTPYVCEGYISPELEKAILALDLECLKFWKEKITPWLIENYCINDKIYMNVEMFRMVSELMYDATSNHAHDARNYFSTIPNDVYEDIISLLIINSAKYKFIGSEKIPHEKINFFEDPKKDLILLYKLLEIRKSNLLGEKLLFMAKFANLLHDYNINDVELRNIIYNPTVENLKIYQDNIEVIKMSIELIVQEKSDDLFLAKKYYILLQECEVQKIDTRTCDMLKEITLLFEKFMPNSQNLIYSFNNTIEIFSAENMRMSASKRPKPHV